MNRRLADNIMTYLALALLSFVAVSSWISNVAAASRAASTEESYLYNTFDSVPVLDHGLSGNDFTKSKSPKVVEFYDPKCGVCQAFKYNYIEVAKKVQAQKPDVEFYGVSCEAYQSICDSHGPPSVPKIFAFPSGGPEGGIRVEKGSGTIYFLSARLMKALRSPEEIAADAENLGNLEAPGRRLRATESEGEGEEGEFEYEGEDEDEDEDEDDEPESEDGDEDEIVSGDEGDSEELPEDEDEDLGSEDEDEDEDEDEELSEDDEESEDNGQSFSVEDIEEPQTEEGSEDGEESGDASVSKDREESNGSPTSLRGRNEYEAPKQKYIALDRRDEKISVGDDRDENLSRASQGGQPAKPLDTTETAKQRGIDPKSDAWRNTIRHFETEDIKHGKPRGYHFKKWNEERDALERERKSKLEAAQNQRATPNLPSSGQSTRENPRQGYVPKTQVQPDPKYELKVQPDPARGRLRHKEEEEASEDPRYAKSAFGPNASANRPGFSNGRPHSGPVPIVDFRDKQPIEKRPPLPPQHLSVGGDIFVPHPFNQDPVRAKKFQEYVARRKEALERKDKMRHPIQSIMGSKNKEEEKKEEEKGQDMTFVHKKVSPMSNYKAQYRGSAAARPPRPPDLRPEAQHKSVGEKVLKKIPIVNRVVKRSKGEETLNDAALSFTRGLLMGVFKSNESLSYKKKQALVDWFDLMRVSLPPEIGLHELIDTLKYNIDDISLRHENLLQILDKHRLPDHMWSQSCRKGAPSGGFFCGFWKLLHVMSVGFAEQAGGLALRESSPSMRVFSSKEAGDVVREYIALFFNCEKCSKRFVAQYDDCSFQRCHRLSDETASASAESWHEFPLWLWQVHNDVSRSKSQRAMDFHEKAGRKELAKQWEKDMSVVYPHIDQCIKCVTSDGTWDLNHVYKHLENEYWTFGHEMNPKMDKFLEYNDHERKSVGHGLGAYVMLSLIMLLTLVAKRQRIRVTGRHKKKEDEAAPLTSSGFSKKYRDS